MRRKRKKSFVICHLTFIICHLKTSGFRNKCHMTHDK